MNMIKKLMTGPSSRESSTPPSGEGLAPVTPRGDSYLHYRGRFADFCHDVLDEKLQEGAVEICDIIDKGGHVAHILTRRDTPTDCPGVESRDFYRYRLPVLIAIYFVLTRERPKVIVQHPTRNVSKKLFFSEFKKLLRKASNAWSILGDLATRKDSNGIVVAMFGNIGSSVQGFFPEGDVLLIEMAEPEPCEESLLDCVPVKREKFLKCDK